MHYEEDEDFEWWGYTYWTLSCCQRCGRPPNLAIEGGFLAFVMWYKKRSNISEKWCESCYESWKMTRVL